MAAAVALARLCLPSYICVLTAAAHLCCCAQHVMNEFVIDRGILA
jgi:hypothetical protein